MSWFLMVLVTIFVMVAGCAHVPPPDISKSALVANDATLFVAACEATPNQGMDVCRVQAGAPIDSSWKLVIPTGASVKGWEASIYFRDAAHHVELKGTGPIVEIPWKSVVGHDVWASDDDGEGIALVSVTYQDQAGLPGLAQFEGIAKVMVLSKGYARLPIDSGAAAWKMPCEIQYSVQGRSALKCQ